MDNLALIESFGDFKDEKGISKIDLMAIIEDSLKTLLKKRYDSDDHFDVIVNPDKGDFQIFLNKKIVEDQMSEDDDLEIEISEAKKIDPTFEVGEEFTQEIPLAQLGRRNILTLKQILATKLQEHNNAAMYEMFKDRIGEVIVGEVHHIRGKQVIILDDEGNEYILPKENQIPTDFFKKGESVRAVIEKVDFKGSKPQIIVSRTAPKFLEKLLELEIPEMPTPPVHEVPEFNGGVPGMPEVTEVPELKVPEQPTSEKPMTPDNGTVPPTPEVVPAVNINQPQAKARVERLAETGEQGYNASIYLGGTLLFTLYLAARRKDD